MFSIDGIVWPYPCTIERKAEMKPSDISGELLDKTYFNDVLGTYMSYSVRIAVPLTDRDTYTQIYEAITAPVDGHSFVFPYNNGSVTITARVQDIADTYTDLHGDGVYWKGIQFTAVANHPTKEVTLAGVIERGRAPIPDVAAPAIGDLYEYTEDGWEFREFTDADAVYY